MKPKIVVACGTGVASSQIVAAKLMQFCHKHSFDVEIQCVPIKDLPCALKDAAAYVSLVKSSQYNDVPVINGIPFLTGKGARVELVHLTQILKDYLSKLLKA